MAAAPARKTCDACRRRKTKCSATTAAEAEAREPCKNCLRLEVPCTFDYVHKRGGRPLGSRDKTARKRAKRKSDDGRSSESPPALSTSELPESQMSSQNPGLASLHLNSLESFTNGDSGVHSNGTHHSLDTGIYAVNTLPSIPPSVQTATFSESPESHNLFASGAGTTRTGTTLQSNAPFGMTLPPPHTSHHPPASVTQDLVPPLNRPNVFSPQSEISSGTHITDAAARQANQAHWRLSPNSNRLPRPSERFYNSLQPPDLDIEDVTDWTTVTFFTSLYLKYNHALSPIVHKPTFAHDLATRRDKTDRQFRSLLFGLVTYTIGQSPITRMDGDFTRRELEVIQDRCHRASVLLHDHTYRSPELNTVGTLIYAYFYCQCNSDYSRAAVLLASACELAQMILTFGYGGRRCIGYELAWLALTLASASIVRNFEGRVATTVKAAAPLDYFVIYTTCGELRVEHMKRRL